MCATIAKQIRWYENLDGLGDFGPSKTLVSNVGDATGLIPIDLDVDGDLDLLT